MASEDRESRPTPSCDGLTWIFYGDEEDLRHEGDRQEREDLARYICSTCPYLFSCLEYALVNNEKDGVWGGMSKGDRREFKSWLYKQGYKPLPTGAELSLNAKLWWQANHDGFGSEPDWDGPTRIRERQSPALMAPQDQADAQPPEEGHLRAS